MTPISEPKTRGKGLAHVTGITKAEVLRRSFDDYFSKMRRSFSISRDKTLADVVAEESQDQGLQTDRIMASEEKWKGDRNLVVPKEHLGQGFREASPR